MTMTTQERFNNVRDQFLKFERVENKRSKLADLHAFLLLGELMQGDDGSDIVTYATHDMIGLRGDADEIDALTDAQILELTRCGVFYDEEGEFLAMYV